MSAQKRKLNSDTSSKPKSAPNTAKKLKRAPTNDQESSTRKLATTSILLEDEKTFPRGRGDGLTPVEKKQIRLKADRDVLFEESAQKHSTNKLYDGFSDEDDDAVDSGRSGKKSQKSKQDLRKENERKRQQKLQGDAEPPKPKGLKPGDVVEGRITKINDDDYDHFLTIEWPNHRKGTVSVTAISAIFTQQLELLLKDDDEEGDANEESNATDLKKYFKRGQSLKAVVTKVVESSHDTSGKPTKGSLQLSTDPRLVNKGLTKNDLQKNVKIQAVVESVEDHGLVMDFALEQNTVKGFLSSNEMPQGRKLSSIKSGAVLLCVVSGTNPNGKVIQLSANNPELAVTEQSQQSNLGLKNTAFTNPVDENLKSLNDLGPGYVTKARISSVKDTQLNVALADGVQGRIDVSEAFQSFDEVRDRKHPLISFKAKQVIPVRVLGIHDARNHRFLPISHRGGHVPVFELSARLGKDDSIMSFDQLKEGECYTATVNNISGSNLWVNLSPIIRGRIERLDLPDDTSELPTRFPVGSLLRVWVKKMDLASARLDLSTRPGATAGVELKLEDVSQGMILAARVTRVEDSRLFVQLSTTVSGIVPLTELADDFDEAHPHKHMKNEMIRVCVMEIDRPNKRIALSARPSKVLSSSLPVKDKQITDFKQLNINDVVRGFIQRVDDIGLFVGLGPGIKALAPVKELFDQYVKDWKPEFQIDRLVKGRVIELDAEKQRLHLSLRESVVTSGYKPLLRFEDLKKNDVVPGKVRKVEEYGVFIVLDNSRNVSGLCHRSQIAERKVEDARGLYDEGDAVKALVLSVDEGKRRVSLSLKPSAFEKKGVKKKLKQLDAANDKGDAVPSDESSDADLENGEEGGIDLVLDKDGNLQVPTSELLETATKSTEEIPTNAQLIASSQLQEEDSSDSGLDAGGFTWNPLTRRRSPSVVSSPASSPPPTKKRRKRAAPYEDHTTDLDKTGPTKPSDFERLLMSDRDDPALWTQYMSHYVSAGDIPSARKIAERATRSISITRDQEKLEIWTAWLNLELLFGDDIDSNSADVSDEAVASDTTGALSFLRDVPLAANVKDVFARACAVHDRALLAQRLVKSLTKFKRLDAARALYERMSHDKAFTAAPDFWVKYATFLLRDADPQDAQAARSLLPRATQILPTLEHPRILMEFARLEFKLQSSNDEKHSGAGDPERGRTLFTELLSAYKKRVDFWDIWLSLEEAILASIPDNEKEEKEEQQARVRDLFERQTLEEGKRMKPKRAKGVFGRWKKFEENIVAKGEMERAKRVDRVKARERRWEEKRGKEKEKEIQG
ncbi:MAG: hypothetical protein Q9159_006177 [Coniocarpon cinnabarinum]